MLLGTKNQLQNVNILTTTVVGTPVSVSKDPVKNLGVKFDPSLTMVDQVNKVVKTATYHIRNIGRLRNKLTPATAKTLVQSLIILRLDYCNSLLYGLPDSLISRLQVIQNKAARIITRTPKTEHITPVLMNLHWLPIKQRIAFKVLLMVYKAINKMSPQYIRDMLIDHRPSRQLRSSSLSLLQEPRSKLKSAGDRAFSIFAPRLWNNTDITIRQSISVESFKVKLKTSMFKQVYE